MPEREQRFATSRGVTIRDGDRIGYGYWHPEKAAWVDEFGMPIGWEPEAWLL